jgi:tetratricopeptide (TPR) repeat protein
MKSSPLACALPLLLLLAACAPRGVDVVMHEALEAQRAGELDKAIARYRRAITAEPRVRGAYNNLAVIALDKGNLTQAVKLLEEELALHPRSSEANRNMAVVLLRLGRPADAVARVAKLASVDGGAPTTRPDRRVEQDEARLVLAVARWMAEEPGEAVRHPANLVLSPAPPGSDPVTREALEARARRTLAARALVDGDAAALAEVSDTEATSTDAGLNRAIVLLRAGDPSAALSRLEPLGDDVQARVVRAAALLALDRRADAALAADGVDAAALPRHLQFVAARVRATLAAATGDWAEALRQLEAAQATGVDLSAGPRLDRATALAHLGQADAARALVQSVLAEHPADPRAQALAAALQ